MLQKALRRGELEPSAESRLAEEEMKAASVKCCLDNQAVFIAIMDVGVTMKDQQNRRSSATTEDQQCHDEKWGKARKPGRLVVG